MHTAPAVAFDADDGGRWRAAVAALSGLAAAVLARWALLWAAAVDGPAAGWPGMDLIAAVAAALAAALAAWRLGRPSPARLIWNSHDWLWQPEGGPALAGRVQVMADLGGWMLLRFDPLAARDPAAAAAGPGTALDPAGRARRRGACGAGRVRAGWRPGRLGARRMNDPQADALLVERVKRGDQRAFEMLVVKYQRRIERLIGRMVRDVDLVADIAQETFIRAYRALPQFRGESAFYTWLYRIAVNTAKKALVDLKRDPLLLESARGGGGDGDGDETSRVENELSDGATPESELASRQVARAVNAAIEALSDDLRQAILLREIEGMSYEEIADAMNCPIGTVRSRIFRAREAIAERLRPLLDTREGTRW